MKTSQNDLLARFGASVLECLAQAPEWNAETLDAIAGEAYALKLARSGENSEFVVCAPAPAVEVLSPANEKRGAVLLVNDKRENACYFCGREQSAHIGGRCPSDVESSKASPDTSGAEARERAAVGMGQAAQASNEAGRAAREASAGHSSFPGIAVVRSGSGELVTVDLVRNQSELDKKNAWAFGKSGFSKAHPFTLAFVPLELCCVAPRLLALVERLAWSAESVAGMCSDARALVRVCPVRFGGPVLSGSALSKMERVSVADVRAGKFPQVAAHYSGGDDSSMSYGAVEWFHVCPVCGWFVAQQYGGAFWTVAGNEDEFFPDLESALVWLRVRLPGA